MRQHTQRSSGYRVAVSKLIFVLPVVTVYSIGSLWGMLCYVYRCNTCAATSALSHVCSFSGLCCRSVAVIVVAAAAVMPSYRGRDQPD